jgi:hypothetical protein
MDDDYCPTAAVRELTANRDARRPLLRTLIEKRYQRLIALDLNRTSPRQLEEAMREYGLSGATHKKALSFFLQAARYAGIPMSPLLKARTRTAGFGHRRAPATPAPPATPPSAPMTKSIRLRTGGTLTLTASLDLFSLGAEDRAFVFDLIDRLQQYDRVG